jgi:riboflavin kinase / FMN adenylyltransferase
MNPLRIVRRLPATPPLAPSALTIGNLDGVHLGHLAMLEQVRLAAQELDLCPSVLTFYPHPRAYFAKLRSASDSGPAQINGLRDKLTRLAQAGMRQVTLLKFDARIANLSAQEFVEQLLVKQLQARWLIVGADFRFGHRRGGDIELLEHSAKKHGFVLKVLSDIGDATGQRISSSLVRNALEAGDMPKVAKLMGRPFRVSGHVTHGKKLGRTLGFPTLNVKVSRQTATRFGIYIVRVHGLAKDPLPGIASLGLRPTVGVNDTVLLETHVLGHSIDAYGKLVSVELLQHVRDEEKFPDLATLMVAMQRDRQHALDYFAHHGLQNNA